MSEAAARLVRAHLRQVPDYPEPGVLFRDITPILAHAEAFRSVIDYFASIFEGQVDVVAGIEARGFLLAAPLAAVLGTGVLLVRKSGKLPPPVYARRYDLEYGSAELEVSGVGIEPGGPVALIDDVLATGGTAEAAAELLEKVGADVRGVGVLLELSELQGRENLAGREVHALLSD